jgi:hypothetical protein
VPRFFGGELLDSCATRSGRRVAWDGAGIRRSSTARSWICSRRAGRWPTSPGTWRSATSPSIPGGGRPHRGEAVHTGSFVLDGDTASWKSMSGEVLMQADAIIGVEVLEAQRKPTAPRKRLKRVS